MGCFEGLCCSTKQSPDDNSFFPYNISKRTNDLANPKIFPNTSKWESKYTQYGVAKAALRPFELSDRMKKLAQPINPKGKKKKKSTRTRYGVSKKALNFKITTRLATLAKSKYVKGMRSDNKTRYGVSKWALSGANRASDHVCKLARHKQYPVWTRRKICKAALKCNASKRIKELAVHKAYFCPEEKPVTEYGVRKSALEPFNMSDRMMEISQPIKLHADGGKQIEYTAAGVAKRALTHKASARTEEIATPRTVEVKHVARVPDVKPDLSKYGISLRALKAKPSARLKQISTPRQYDINPGPGGLTKYGVPEKALNYKITPTITKLAVPRIIRSKFKSVEST